ncbi:FMN-dependent NADH-azoreductase [Planctobacterium marinum]|uniref:FMN-dependent NADH-azoreductase n=1 Tax=Planctobacterium marinum TaxID=1631968 RepID=UPI001E49714E|nr:NAD(P)H-dependent oxidoreductase [Planctobacterium marinum]MCC2604457.1 NAD(P)H-dependent oxidoreductase [Planctobacterium marinum]
MKNVLVVNSSINGEQGNSNKLVQDFLRQLGDEQQVEIETLDLSKRNIGHLSAEEMQSWMTAPEERNDVQKALASLSDDFVYQVQQADVIVLGVPMYNFGVPSTLKAWIDRIARAGITFRYTENGPQGLLENKKVYVMAARGGMYAGTAKDSQTTYLNDFFAFVGITDVEFVYAEGLAMGAETANSAFEQANEKIIELINKTAA